MTMTTTNHDDQLGEIYLTMLNELNCISGVSFSVHLALVFHVFIAVAIMVMACGHHGIGLLCLLDSRAVRLCS